MERICILVLYFGVPKDSFTLYLESCKRNPTIDWLFVVDFDIKGELTDNIKVMKATLSDVEKRAREKIMPEIQLDRPYKLCDCRPFYGLLFEQELCGYDWWGYQDTDLINGDIRACFERIPREGYDKINRWGHLSLLRNTPELNRLCLSDGGVLLNQRNCGFDERGFNEILLASGKNIYTGPWAADIDCFYKRMRCVDKRTMQYLCKVPKQKWAPRNYAKQLFVSLNGRIFRYYCLYGKVMRDEFAYIHFRKECPVLLPSFSEDSFIITRDGFYPLDEAELQSAESLKSLVCRYNLQEGLLKETLRFAFHFFRSLKLL